MASGAQSKRCSPPMDPSLPSLGPLIPPLSPLTSLEATLGVDSAELKLAEDDAVKPLGDEAETNDGSRPFLDHMPVCPLSTADDGDRCVRGLESVKAYLRDLYHLSVPALEPRGSFDLMNMGDNASCGTEDAPQAIVDRSACCPAVDGAVSHGVPITCSGSRRETRTPSAHNQGGPDTVSKRFNDDRSLRTHIIREIYETERTYVRRLSELVSIYVNPASMPISSSKKETIIPAAERKLVFGNVETIFIMHRDHLLPALEKAVRPLLDMGDDLNGTLSACTAHYVGEVFRIYIAYMKQYSAYVNNFDNALCHIRAWSSETAAGLTRPSAKVTTGASAKLGPIGIIADVAMVRSAALALFRSVPHSGSHLTPSQNNRVLSFIMRAKTHPQHSQMDLESYLILPVQRVPRYKLLLENLAICTPQSQLPGPVDALDEAINSVGNLASLINEAKRAAESRLRLLHWQQRIACRGSYSLVQPYRTLVLEGALSLVGVAKKVSAYVEVDADGDGTTPGLAPICPVEYLDLEPMNKPIMLLLCSDALVMVRKRSAGDWEKQVDLFRVLPMATLHGPACMCRTNDGILRVVDNEVGT